MGKAGNSLDYLAMYVFQKPLDSFLTPFTLYSVEAGKLLPHLVRFSMEHRQEGTKLQESIVQFEEKFRSLVDEIWAVEVPSLDQQVVDSEPPVKDTPKPAKPGFRTRDWTVKPWL